MDHDIVDFIPWAFALAPGLVGTLLALNGEPVWAGVTFAFGTLVILSLALPYVILFFRNPTGDRLGVVVELTGPYEAWGHVCRRRQRLLNFYANRELRGKYYGLWADYLPSPDEVLDWYGEDVYTVAATVADLRRKHHDAAQALQLFADAQVTDFDRMLDYLAAVEPEVALYALLYDVPLEYATAMAPTETHA